MSSGIGLPCPPRYHGMDANPPPLEARTGTLLEDEDINLLSYMSLTVMLKIVNATLKAKAKAWTGP